jgi:hypothetical protein
MLLTLLIDAAVSTVVARMTKTPTVRNLNLGTGGAMVNAVTPLLSSGEWKS